MNNELWKWSAVDLRKALLNSQLSAGEVTQAITDRMAALNPGHNAVILDLTESANKRASDPLIVDSGKLGGIPITIKENLDLMGCPTSNGVPAFTDTMPTSNAPVSQHLLDAGAVVVGRTNAPEFSIRWQTDNPLHGLTLNPWDHQVTCGGSSGGAAVATMLGIGPIAHGNDIGGSLRCPAYCCGATTVRPTFGRVPAFNSTFREERPFVAQLMSVQGIIAREVKDVRLATEVISGADPRDPFWVPVPFNGPPAKHPIKVAYTTEGYGLPIHPAVVNAVEMAAKHLQEAGYEVEEVRPPEVEYTNELWRNLLFSEFKRKVDASINIHGSDDIKRAMQGYYSVSKELSLQETMDSLAQRNSLLRKWNLFQENYPLLISPVILQPPYQVGEDIVSEEKTAQTLLSYLYMSNNNLLGLPAATISTGLHNGVPIGVQITGPRFREDICLDAAEAIETIVGVMAKQLWQKIN